MKREINIKVTIENTRITVRKDSGDLIEYPLQGNITGICNQIVTKEIELEDEVIQEALRIVGWIPPETSKHIVGVPHEIAKELYLMLETALSCPYWTWDEAIRERALKASSNYKTCVRA